ncbi:MAG: amidase, partial [Pseudonocardia sp.]|nr:amidase [Pseudonocardia sp.]
GGSIRIPAAYCGLVGVKPGRGAVSLPGGAYEHWCGLSTVGPLARTAEDAALLLSALAGQPFTVDEPGPAHVALSLSPPLPLLRVHADHRAAAVGAAARLRAAPGAAAVTLADPPYPRTLGLVWSRRWHAGVAKDATALDLDLDAVERRTAAVARRGRRALRFAPPREAAMAAWRDRVLEWFDAGGYDVLVGPATARPPVTAGALAGRGYAATLARSAWRVPFSQAWNLAGLPAVVAPVRIGGRPVGVQLVGRPGAESALLSAAARLEQRVVPMAGAAPKRIYV